MRPAPLSGRRRSRQYFDRKRIESELHELQRRLMALALASASILESPSREAVLSATIDLARDVFTSDAYALWRCEADSVWRVARSFGISEQFAARAIAAARDRGQSPVAPFARPQVFENVATVDMLADMRDAYAREGIASMVVFPLRIRGERSGTLVLYSHHPRTYSEIDLQVGAALANLAAAALTTAELYEEQRHAREAADHARRQATFLAEAGSVLSASLDYENTLSSIAALAVPTIADWCGIDILGEGGRLQRLAVAHVDPNKVEFARLLQQKYPADPTAPGGVHDVIRTGTATAMSRIPSELLEASARDEEHLRILRELQLTSYMCAPLIAQGKPFGAITFVSAESGREYSDADLRSHRNWRRGRPWPSRTHAPMRGRTKRAD